MTAEIIHDLPAKLYHEGKGLSASVISGMARMTPAEVRHRLGNPSESEHMLLGTLTHVMILEPDRLEKSFMVVPKFDRRSKADKQRWADYVADAEALGQTVVREGETGEVDLARAMRDAVHANPDARELLKVGHPEVSLYAEDPQTGILLRSREDWMPDSNVVVDLKTARDAGKWFAADAFKLGYHIAAHHYCHVRQQVNLTNDGPIDWPEYRWIVVGSAAPHLVAVYEPDADMMELGRRAWERGLVRWMDCNATDTWPGLPHGVTQISPPAWALKDLDEPERRELSLDELMAA